MRARVASRVRPGQKHAEQATACEDTRIGSGWPVSNGCLLPTWALGHGLGVHLPSVGSWGAWHTTGPPVCKAPAQIHRGPGLGGSDAWNGAGAAHTGPPHIVHHQRGARSQHGDGTASAEGGLPRAASVPRGPCRHHIFHRRFAWGQRRPALRNKGAIASEYWPARPIAGVTRCPTRCCHRCHRCISRAAGCARAVWPAPCPVASLPTGQLRRRGCPRAGAQGPVGRARAGYKTPGTCSGRHQTQEVASKDHDREPSKTPPSEEGDRPLMLA